MKANRPTVTGFACLLMACLATLSSCGHAPGEQARQGKSMTTDSSIEVTAAELDVYRDGLVALHNNDDHSAEAIFERFVTTRPELAGAYTNLALIRFRSGDYDESLRLVNQAIEKNPEQAQAYNLRAQLHIAQRDTDAAEANYIRAIELDPGYVNAHYNLALLYVIYLQDIERAVGHYETYLSLVQQPDNDTSDWVTHLRTTLES